MTRSHRKGPPDPSEVAARVLADKGQGRLLPTNLEALLQGEEVELEFFEAERNIDGLFELCAGRPTIFVNTRGRERDYPRVRFTLAHELGHFFLHRSLLEARSFRDDRISLEPDIEEVEREANEFAIEALLPTRLMDDLFRQTRLIDIDFIARLATKANVSLHATAIRVARQTSNRIGVLLVKEGRIEWVVVSDDWHHSWLPTGSLRGRPLPSGSASARRAGDFREERVPLSAWAPNQRWKRADLYESAITTSYGRLVFLGAEEDEE